MKLSELVRLLSSQPRSSLSFILPAGAAIPAHFHVTEVGRIEKSFIDCGGTFRSNVTCQLQLWTADDIEHRIQPDKILKVIQLASPIFKSDDLEVEVEYGQELASVYVIDKVVSALGNIQLYLSGKQTDCLAKDKCGVNGCNDLQGCC